MRSPKKFLPIWAQDIASARKRKGLTQSQLAEIVGISQSAVTDWERGKNKPTAENLEKLREVLGVRGILVDGFYNKALKIIDDGGVLEDTPFDKLNKKQQLYLFFKTLFSSIKNSLEPEYVVDFAEYASWGMRDWLRYHDAFVDRRGERPLSQCLDEEIKKITRSALKSAMRDRKQRELSDEEFMVWLNAEIEKNTGNS